MVTTAKPKAIKINSSEIQPGHFFSELSHYRCEEKYNGYGIYKHLGSEKNVKIDDEYVSQLMQTAEQYHTVVEVGLEDKYWTAAKIMRAIAKGEFTDNNAPEIGDLEVPGIRTIWENIHSKHVFTCMFLAQSRDTAAELKAKREEQAMLLAAKVKTVWNKTTLRREVAKLIKQAQDKPIVKELRERVLRGYKEQFTSRDGKYMCMDLSIGELRPVNINTLQWIVFDGVKYVYKK